MNTQRQGPAKSQGIMLIPDLAQAAFEGRKTVTRRMGNRYAKWGEGRPVHIKETWAAAHNFDACKPSEIPHTARIQYAGAWPFGGHFGLGGLRVRPSLFMPEWASRTRKIITSIRSEKLHAITASDAIREGIEFIACGSESIYRDYTNYRAGAPFDVGAYTLDCPIESFRTLWEAINGKGSWEKNPDLWRIELGEVPA